MHKISTKLVNSTKKNIIYSSQIYAESLTFLEKIEPSLNCIIKQNDQETKLIIKCSTNQLAATLRTQIIKLQENLKKYLLEKNLISVNTELTIKIIR